MKYSKENPKMLSPRQNTGGPPTSAVLSMWEMGCISWCLSISYQVKHSKSLARQCWIRSSHAFYQRHWFLCFYSFRANNSLLGFIEGSITEKKIIQPLTSLCSISLLCSSLSEYQTTSAVTWQDYSQFPPTLDCPLFPPTPTSHPLWLRDKNMAHKHHLWRSICPVFSCWI